MITETSYATNGTALGEITRDAILAALEKMRVPCEACDGYGREVTLYGRLLKGAR